MTRSKHGSCADFKTLQSGISSIVVLIIMPSFLTPNVFPLEGLSAAQQDIYAAWGGYIKDMQLAESLWERGYTFIVLGRDIHHIADLECGEPIALMLIVLRYGTPVDPLKISSLRDVLTDVDEYERETLSMFVRLASWSRGRIQGPMELYIHSPQNDSCVVPIEAYELAESFVCTEGYGAAPIIEFDPRFSRNSSIGTVQKTQGAFGRLCVKAHGSLYSIR